MSLKTYPNLKIFLVTVIAVISLYVLIMNFVFNWNITGFYRFGDKLPLSPYLNKSQVLIHQNQVGYDGQFFLTIALDPSLSNEGTINSIDFPRYRMKRILLPLIGYILGIGNRHLIPYTLIILNCLLICLATFFISKYYGLLGKNQLQSLLYLCIPGIWVSFSFSTSELAVSAFVIASYYFYRSEKSYLSAFLVLMACLTKETALIFWGGFVFQSVMTKKWRDVGIFSSFLLPFVVWHIYLSLRFPDIAQLQELGNFNLILKGHLDKVNQLFSSGGHVNKNEYIFYFALVLCAIFSFFQLPHFWKKQKALFAASCGYLLIFLQSSMAILDYHIGYSRVFLALYIILLLSEKPIETKLSKGFWIFTGLVAARYLYWFIK